MPVSPNTQPIFFRTIIHWGIQVTNQVAATNPGSAVPALLGTASDNGALIETIECIPMTGAGTGTLNFFTKSDDNLYKVICLPVTLTANTKAVVALPRILAPFRNNAANAGDYAAGLRLQAGESLYVAATATITGDGWWVHAWGGHY